MIQSFKIKFASSLLVIFVFSSTLSIAQNTASIATGNDCPKKAKEWNEYRIRIKNVDNYLLCFEDLKKDFEADKTRKDMDKETIHTCLLNGYKKLIQYYLYGDGDGEGIAKDYEDDLKSMELKKPIHKKDKKENKNKKKDDDNDDGDDN